MSKNVESQVKYFNKYVYGMLGGSSEYDFANKPACIRQHIAYMLNRTQSMFRWNGLPNTIPERSLELFLQTNGNVCFYKHNGDLYVFTGGMGGEPDAYYMPTVYTIANPALKLSKALEIGSECVVMPNDSLYLGLIPMFTRYASGMTENELSMKLAIINSRIVDLISAPDDRTRSSAEKFLADIVDGKPGVIAENAFLDGIRAQPYGTTANSNALTNLIEMEQYFKASWFNELGLNANYNMKRESLNTSESQMNNDALLPLVDDMLKCRERAVEKVNEMFGTEISVSLASSWEDNEQEIKLEHEQLSGQPEPDEMKGGVAENVERTDGAETVE